jgi:hypothetical protein
MLAPQCEIITDHIRPSITDIININNPLYN